MSETNIIGARASLARQILLEPADIGKCANRSAPTIKRVAAEIGIEPMRTPRGARLFTAEQADAIKTEIARREREDRQ